MLNSDLVNSSLLNSSNTSVSFTLETDAVVFNGFSLTGLCSGVQNTMVKTSNHRNLSQVDLKTYDFPRIDGGAILGRKYSKKTIEMEMFIKASSNQELEEMIDTLKYNTSKINGILDFNFGNSRRQIQCTLVSMDIPNFNKLAVQIDGIKLTWESYDPNFKNAIQSNSTFTGVTGDLVESLNNIGTVQTIPTYYFTFGTGLAGLTDISINLGGYTITISRTINDNDIVIFNGTNFSVTVNGLEVEYSGSFQELDVGETPVIFTFTPASTFSVDINVFWNKNYL